MAATAGRSVVSASRTIGELTTRDGSCSQRAAGHRSDADGTSVHGPGNVGVRMSVQTGGPEPLVVDPDRVLVAHTGDVVDCGLKIARIGESVVGRHLVGMFRVPPVSYTHLTLPTIYSV